MSLCAALSCLVLGSVSSSHVVLLDFQPHLFNSPWLLGSDWVPPSCAEAWTFSQGSKLGQLQGSLELEPRSFASLANILYFHTIFQVSCPLPDGPLPDVWMFCESLFHCLLFAYFRWKSKCYHCYFYLAGSRNLSFFKGLQFSLVLYKRDSGFSFTQRYQWLNRLKHYCFRSLCM